MVLETCPYYPIESDDQIHSSKRLMDLWTDSYLVSLGDVVLVICPYHST